MPLIINSAPDCITHVEGAKPADDSADFILQANFQDCAGFMTFGPGTTWGDGGAAATTQYYFLIWIGAAVMVAAFVAWIIFENRRLVGWAVGNALGRGGDGDGPPPAAPAT